VHLVALAWIYIIGTMALTAASVAGGVLLFVFAGVAPLMLVAALGVLRRRARRAATGGAPEGGGARPASMGEHGVRQADHSGFPPGRPKGGLCPPGGDERSEWGDELLVGEHGVRQADDAEPRTDQR
jgi:hypothetical protein